MKVLVTGYAGQLGWDTVRQLEARGIECRGVDMQDFDLTDEAVEELVSTSHHPNMLNNPVEITDEILRDMYNSYR